MVKNVTDKVTVAGEVSGAVPLSVGGDRLLDVVVAAGGAAAAGAAAGGAAEGGVKAPVWDTFVRLSRDGVTETIPMESLVSDPAENIYAWPGDILTVLNVPQTFSVFGATTTNSDVPFGAEKLT